MQSVNMRNEATLSAMKPISVRSKRFAEYSLEYPWISSINIGTVNAAITGIDFEA